MSKKCPQCGSIYTDQTLNYCLTDGSPLIYEEIGEKTLELPNKETEQAMAFNSLTKENTSETQTNQKFDKALKSETYSKKKVSRFWVIATICLFAILLIGIGLISFNLNVFDTSKENLNANKLSTNIPESNRLNSSKVLSSTPHPTPKTETYRVRGVANNDVLFIRPAPGNLKVKVGSIPPNGSGIIITGKGKRIGKSNWVQVNYKGIKGWVNNRHLAKEN